MCYGCRWSEIRTVIDELLRSGRIGYSDEQLLCSIDKAIQHHAHAAQSDVRLIARIQTMIGLSPDPRLTALPPEPRVRTRQRAAKPLKLPLRKETPLPADPPQTPKPSDLIIRACRSCGDQFLPTEGLPPTSPHCLECYQELKDGFLPRVTDSNLPPPGTGTVPRQQIGRGKTDG